MNVGVSSVPSTEKSTIVRQQLKHLDFAVKLLMLLQGPLRQVNDNNDATLSNDQVANIEASLTFIQQQIQSHRLLVLPAEDLQATLLEWIEPWYTSTHLSTLLKQTLGKDLKVIGGSRNSYKGIVDWALKDFLKWTKKFRLSENIYDDSEFCASLMTNTATGGSSLSNFVSARPSSTASQLQNEAVKKRTKSSSAVKMEKIHDKLVSFMAPSSMNALWDNETMDQFYASLPGKNVQKVQINYL